VAKGEKVGILKVRLYRPFDGKRFIAALPNTPQAGQTPITVILNWQQQLKKK
jgi:hypothetical protein